MKTRPKGPCVVLHCGRVLALCGRPRMLLPPTAETFFAGTVFVNLRRAQHAVKTTRRLLAEIATSLHRDNPKLIGRLDPTRAFAIWPLLPATKEKVEPKRRRGPKAPPPNLELFARELARGGPEDVKLAREVLG